MKKWIVPVVIIALVFLFAISSYNGLVGTQADAKTAWSKVESSYQRRNDLIGNLVKTVQGAADFEKSTLEAVIGARARATQMTIDPANLTPENIAKFQAAQGELSGALSRLLVTVEQYPDLKANQNFRDLQAQLEGTENRIKVARNDFNDAVQSYNTSVKTFPAILYASMFGFTEKGYFEADAGAEKAPAVDFGK